MNIRARSWQQPCGAAVTASEFTFAPRTMRVVISRSKATSCSSKSVAPQVRGRLAARSRLSGLAKTGDRLLEHPCPQYAFLHGAHDNRVLFPCSYVCQRVRPGSRDADRKCRPGKHKSFCPARRARKGGGPSWSGPFPLRAGYSRPSEAVGGNYSYAAKKVLPVTTVISRLAAIRSKALRPTQGMQS